jgi:hypothetical protein
MTTYDHSVNAAQIIEDAYLLCGGKDEDEPLTGSQTTTALRSLNNMMKAWQADGFHVWKRQEIIVFLNKEQQSYELGNIDQFCIEDDFVYSTLSADVSAAATTLPVVSSAGMADNDQIGIELSDGTRFWTTISGITSTTSIRIATGLSGAASSAGTVFTYTTQPERPLRPLHARRAPYNGSDVPIDIEPLNEYFDTPNKSSSGTVNFVSWKATRGSSTLYVWQTANSVRNVVKLTVESPIADFDTVAENPDFPVEWSEAITYNLAMRMEPTIRVLSADRRAELRRDAQVFKQDLLDFDADVGSLYLQANAR